MTDIKQLTEKILAFRDERDWAQYHNPKDLAVSLVLEASEVIEHFQWRNGDEIDEYLKDHKDDVAEELADVFYLVMLMCHDMDIDIAEAVEKKLIKNAKKYPIEKSGGEYVRKNG